MVRAFLSLGSNLADRRAILDDALTRLEAPGRISVIRRSSLYETAPVGKTDQPAFLNLVAEVETSLAPDALLDILQDAEQAFGRTRTVRWGPRTLDIDILLYGDTLIRTERLVVPHPEMTRRRFVIEPLVEIAPDLVLPDGRPVRGVLETVLDQDVRRVAP
ncbi:MAG: 2-amino-4-hydroxy-6-hydroxymethyldihydropteridine diphosphokinase [bacterium]